MASSKYLQDIIWLRNAINKEQAKKYIFTLHFNVA